MGMPMDAKAVAALLRRVARGRHGHEHLSMDEAEGILAALLEPDADPLQLGAFLIAQRMKGETAPELAGFVRAARNRVTGYGHIRAADGCVDLPCYAGKRRAAPMHLAAALEARDAGIPIFVHGVAHIEGRLSAWQALAAAGVARAGSLEQAQAVLRRDGIVYADLAELCPALFHIYGLRPKLGVRSFAHTVARLLNPLGCAGQLNGCFHTPYADRMAGANALLGQAHSLIFMGAEGEPELYAERQKLVAMQRGDDIRLLDLPDSGCDPYPKQRSGAEAMAARFAAILNGEMDARETATLARMRAAFRWAAGGELPADWVIMEV
jgi:anthranilate phosphoribosyltransferase